VIYHLAPIADTAIDLIVEPFARLDAVGNVGQQRHLTPDAPQYTLYPSPDPQGAQKIEQIRRLKNRSPPGVLGQRTHIVRPSQRKTTLGIQQMAGFAGFLQPLLDLNKDRGWFQR
jgi:hypothetical protein